MNTATLFGILLLAGSGQPGEPRELPAFQRCLPPGPIIPPIRKPRPADPLPQPAPVPEPIEPDCPL